MTPTLEIFAMIQFSCNGTPIARPVHLIGIDPEGRAARRRLRRIPRCRTTGQPVLRADPEAAAAPAQDASAASSGPHRGHADAAAERGRATAARAAAVSRCVRSSTASSSATPSLISAPSSSPMSRRQGNPHPRAGRRRRRHHHQRQVSGRSAMPLRRLPIISAPR